MQRYVETAGELKRALSVIKVRGSGHSKEIRAYEISDAGISIGAVMTDHEGVMSGRPVRLP
ncbi:ATPase domain-containing protein [Pseudoduganella sp. UC29_106]|uniref:ATPase domain-containing protein n=1 Tax=Pseudoduganella sp. UC29_106 TaxID=3374553 RepID=UPI00375731DD